MKRVILGLVILVTAANLTAGAAYAAACMGTNGTRYCGSQCASTPDGACGCSGSCTAEEKAWVNAGSKENLAEMEMLAY